MEKKSKPWIRQNGGSFLLRALLKEHPEYEKMGIRDDIGAVLDRL